MAAKKALPTPTLDRLMAAGAVRKDGSSYVGTAADGVEVQFGAEPSQVERYLTANPTPDKW